MLYHTVIRSTYPDIVDRDKEGPTLTLIKPAKQRSENYLELYRSMCDHYTVLLSKLL